MAPKTSRPAAAPEPVSNHNGFSLISNQKLLQLYATMLKCRMIDERMKTGPNKAQTPRAGRGRVLTSPGDLKASWRPVLGLEAALAGVLIDLVAEDTIVSPPGNFMPLFIKTGSLDKLLASVSGAIASPDSAAGSLRRAVAAALDDKANGKWTITITFPGHDAAARRAWKEALALASLHTLPIIFVSHSQHNSSTKAVACPSIPVDGHDVVAVYRVAFESISKARQGRGPTLIECRRWQAADSVHNADNNPIHNMEKYLTRKGLFTAAIREEILAGFRKELDSAIAKTGK
ncbi:MAG: thiamine pyrophosphate-dependent enzyme [Terracidiphilus sp.]|jgi:pyruvate dehydrogenase E1 component alpha subunit